MAASHSGTSTGNDTKRQPPVMLFRGDSRPPSVIFQHGFQAKGGSTGDTEVVKHVLGDEYLRKTGLISTSQSRRIPPIFMQPQLKNGKLDTITAKDGQIYTKRKGWVYDIKTAHDMRMVYVPDILKDPKMKAIYSYQQEWAVEWEIPAKHIKNAQRVEGYVRREDLFDGRGPFLISPPEVGQVFHETEENPNYPPNS